MSWPSMPSVPSVPSVWHPNTQAAGAQAPAVNMGMYQQYALQQQSWEQWQLYQTQLAQWQAQYGDQVSDEFSILHLMRIRTHFFLSKQSQFSFITVSTNAMP